MNPPTEPLSELLSLDDLVSLVKTGQAVAGTIDHDALLARILETAGQLTDSPDGSIILHDARRNSLYFAHAIGSAAQFLLSEFGEHATKQIPLDSKAGEVFYNRKTIVQLALGNDPKHFKGVDEATTKRTESMITIPLLVAEESIGVMQVLNKRSGEYSERDQLLLEHLGSHAALALRNVRLIGDLLAHMGLYSRGQKKRGAQELVNSLSTPPRTERMTIMFVDLRGFRALCQRISTPQKLLKMLDQFLSMLVDQVLSHDGVVNKYLGDGILAFFQNDNHEVRAVGCAFDMVDAFAPLKHSWVSESNADISFVDIGIGVCTDDVTIGPVGSQRIKDFSVIGTAVNLAAAFEFEARGGKRVLVDQPTYSKVKSYYSAESPVSYELRQPDQPTGHSYMQYSLHRKEATIPRPFVCFISFSHKDQDFIDKTLVEDLKQQGILTFVAPHSIQPGRQWLDKITEGLETCDFLLVVISENSAKSEWVSKEINVAMTLPRLSERIIPVCIDATMPGDVHRFLAPIEAIEYAAIPQLHTRLKGLFDGHISSGQKYASQ